MSLLTLPEPDAAILGRRDDIIRQLRKLVPAATLITDVEGRRTFETDALTAYRCLPLAVVLPGSTEEVSKLLRCRCKMPSCSAYRA
jgi:glycolate oxidase